MCERNDTPAGESSVGNHVYAKFKKELSESGFKSKCRKCNQQEGSVLLQKKDVFCGECLLEYVRHKFRSSIGKSKVLGGNTGEKVLVAVSGGTSSLAMVDMIRDGLEREDVHRRPKYSTSVVHVDESILNSYEEPPTLSRDLFTFLITASGLDLYLTSIEASASKSSNHLLIAADDPASFEEKFSRVQEFLTEQRAQFGNSFLSSLNRLQSSTSKQDFVSRLRILALVKLAKAVTFTRIFVGSTRTELATALLADISLGRGIEVQSEMAFLDDRFGSTVTILRPCRELTAKELAFYVRIRGLDRSGTLSGSRHSFITAKPTKSAIHRLTEAFLGGLAEEFPSTVYTVFNTGNKITSASNSISTLDIEDLKSQKEEVKRCRFCWAKIDTHFLRARNEYSAFEALQLTSALSIGEEGKVETFKTSKFCYSCLRLSEEMGVEEFRNFCIVESR